MRIVVVGGGNVGTQFAVHLAEKEHEVTIYTSCPELFNEHLNIVDENGETIHEGDIRQATSDPETAFRNADLIIVTMPSTMMKDIAHTIFAHTDARPLICVAPGNGGSECAFKHCIDRGNVFFGLERVPAISRLVQKGKTVRSTGYRNELHVSALPKENAERCAALISSIFDIETTVIPNFLNLTLTPSNPILHTARLKTLFGDWHDGVVYPSMPLFYEEWDNESSELLLACDDEVQSICKALPEFELQHVISLREYYESPTAEAMTNKISSIKPFKGLVTPTINADGGVIPDLHSRYFTADFSYGLTIIKQVAEFAGVQTPNIDSILSWYRNIAIEREEFNFADYGIVDFDSFKEFYLL